MFGSNLETALFLALVVMAVIGYLKSPLTKVKFLMEWLVSIRLAYQDGEHIVIWIIPYVTFGFGLLLSYMFNVDLVSSIIPGASPLAAKLLSAIIIGCGSNVIHDVVGGRKPLRMLPITACLESAHGEDCCPPAFDKFMDMGVEGSRPPPSPGGLPYNERH